jgi:hypothetical protein
MMHDRERSPVSARQEAAREVIAGAAIEPHAVAIPARDDSKSVVLDLVQPQVARTQLVGLCREARRDEPGREGTLQRVATNRIGHE